MALIFQHCPLFYCKATALKSRTFVLKSRTIYTTKFVRDLNAKVEQWETAGEATWGVALHREAMIHPSAEHPRLSSESIPEAENQLRSHYAVRDFGTNMPLNSAIWVQNLGITTHFPRFECSVTAADWVWAGRSDCVNRSSSPGQKVRCVELGENPVFRELAAEFLGAFTYR
jgi:hypothetical protein